MKCVCVYKCKQKIRVLYVIDRTIEEIARGKEEEAAAAAATIKLHKERGA